MSSKLASFFEWHLPQRNGVTYITEEFLTNWLAYYVAVKKLGDEDALRVDLLLASLTGYPLDEAYPVEYIMGGPATSY